MTGTDLKHRLAAILAADAVGYSRLMGADERGTLAALDSARTIFRKHIESNRGLVIDTAGDSILAVFDLATGAVAASLAIQEELKVGMELVPEDRRMRFRIGVHIGEVIEKTDSTVYGNGVNIAARLQAKAPAGAVCMSQTIYDTVKGRVSMQARFLGPESFKNIAEPIPIWLVVPEGMHLPESVAEATVAREQSAADAKSIAVLPFTNMSNDKDAGYFADGVHEDLLTQLALLGELKVVSRTSVMDYRNTTKNMRQIGRELGVGALVEGSVRRAGNKVRVSAQLIDSAADRHLWAKSYDRELKDIFAIQSELATEIAKALNVALAPQEQARLAATPTDNVEAYELFLQAQALYNETQGTLREVATRRQQIALLSTAVELDPRFAVAWARLGSALGREYGEKGQASDLANAKAAIAKALSLAPANPLVRLEEAALHSDALTRHKDAADIYEAVLTAAPYNVEALNGLATIYLRQGRMAERIVLLERTLAVEPHNFGTLMRLKTSLYMYRHYGRALATLKMLLALRPDDIRLQTEYQYIDYLRTGSWANYEVWRSEAQHDVERTCGFAKWLAQLRALDRRDYITAERLASSSSDDLKGSELIACRTYVARALIARVSGDQARACEIAGEGLQALDNVLAKEPGSYMLLLLKAQLHAVRGESDAAYATHANCVAVAKTVGGQLIEHEMKQGMLGLNALLGRHSDALADVEKQLRLPDGHPNGFRLQLDLGDLWNNSRFLDLVSNPEHLAPLSFDIAPF